MKTIQIISALIVLLLIQACDEHLADINDNPNSINEIEPEYLFSSAVLSTVGSANARLQFPFGLQYGHYMVGQNVARFVDTYQDNFTTDKYKETFYDIYAGPIKSVKEVLRMTEPGGEYENEAQHAMGKIIESYNFIRLSDAFGAIPYQEGGLGQEDILNPEYDQVEDIYHDCVTVLEDALEILGVASPESGFPGADPLFENSLEQWIKFANSLRFRLAMRMRLADPEGARTIIESCIETELIEENEDNAKRLYQDGDITEFHNPIHSSVISYFSSKMSAMLVETLRNLNDPRLELFAKPNDDGEYLGLTNGLSDEYLGNANVGMVSDPSDLITGRGATVYLITASEIWLLRAEAALFNIIPGDPNQLYRQGIRSAMEQWSLPDSIIDSYLTETHTNLSGSQEEMFEQIGTQLWIGFLPDGFEGWSSIRRTGYPRIVKRTQPVHELGVTDGILPKRMKYPSNEVNINHVNYLKALEAQGPDEILTPLWWDARN